MKLTSVLIAAAYAKPDERMGTFSIDGEYGQLDNDHSWWAANTGDIQMNYMNERTDLALQALFPEKTASNWGERWAKMRVDMNRIKNDSGSLKLCQDNGDERKRRSDERFMKDYFSEGQYDSENNSGAIYMLAFGHARWIQMEILPECPHWGMKLLRRCDRWWRFMQYRYCQKVDDSAKFCPNLKKKGDTHPKNWDVFQNDAKYGKQKQN